MFCSRLETVFAAFCLILVALAGPSSFADQADKLEFHRDIQPLLTKYCVGCHNAKEAEGEFACDTFENLLRGNKEHVVLKPSAADDSFLIKLIEGSEEPKMPPEDEAQPTKQEKILIRKWIDQGAYVDKSTIPLRERLKVADVPAQADKPAPITSLLMHDDAATLIVGRYGRVDFESREDRKVMASIEGLAGKVTGLRWSKDGSKIVVASGIAGVGGQITIVDVASREIDKQIEAHNDTLYAAVLSPDGRLVASAGYDRRILLHDVATGELVRRFDGHNGAVYDLDFDPTGQLLASCSADETSKIWQVSTGLRLDTLSQGEAEQYTVRFSPDGRRVLAAGADRRVRVWELISKEREAINPMLHSLFAHEKAILWFRLSPDGKYMATAGEDRTIKLWTTRDMRPVAELGATRDVPSDAVWNRDQSRLMIGTLSGEIESFEVGEPIQRFVKLESERKTAPKSMADNDAPEDDSEPTETTAEAWQGREAEPNNNVKSALVVQIPASVQGSIANSTSETSDKADEDWFAFDAQAGDTWLITASPQKEMAPLAPSSGRGAGGEGQRADDVQPDAQNANANPDDAADADSMKKTESMSKPQVDPRIEICDANGQPVLRTRLQAVRESYFTFRGKDSTISDDFRLHRWEDMEINEYLYSGGEVVKLWLYPRGPDSGFKVYPGNGGRWTYFDTTPISHAMGEPAWIVRELAPDEAPAPNGLPVFPIYYENDDDSMRKNGKAGRLFFTAPADGRYFVRVRDARGLQDEGFGYQLTIQQPRPDYRINSPTKELAINAGSGGEFSIGVDRLDGFLGPIDLRFDGVPEGIKLSQPMTIEAEQTQSFGTIFIPEGTELKPATISINVRGIAVIDGKKVVRRLKAPLKFKLDNKEVVKTRFVAKDDLAADEIEELVIRPGQTISTFIAVERGKEKDDVPYGKEDSGRNLPHGVFVDNVGLSGLVIKPGQNTREVFITAAPWVEPQVRPFHLRTTLKGTPTTKPIMLRVVAP